MNTQPQLNKQDTFGKDDEELEIMSKRINRILTNGQSSPLLDEDASAQFASPYNSKDTILRIPGPPKKEIFSTILEVLPANDIEITLKELNLENKCAFDDKIGAECDFE